MTAVMTLGELVKAITTALDGDQEATRDWRLSAIHSPYPTMPASW